MLARPIDIYLLAFDRILIRLDGQGYIDTEDVSTSFSSLAVHKYLRQSKNEDRDEASPKKGSENEVPSRRWNIFYKDDLFIGESTSGHDSSTWASYNL